MNKIITSGLFVIVVLLNIACAEKKSANAPELKLSEYLETFRVFTTESGLQYRVLVKGDGLKPVLTDTVVVHYVGKKIDGTEFDSSIRRGEPATYPIFILIDGWKEALLLMNVGSKYRLVIPPELAYGEKGAGTVIGPNEIVIFEVELLEIL